ncbi:MAG TPA: tetratricopeptide repeat protein [Bryobacteraceae bacterium]|nr:tetratricopeptide repeat protein [Bryobacteraceae bacterium]
MDICKLAICIVLPAVWAAGANGDWDAHFRSGEALDRAGQYAASAVEFEMALAVAEHFLKTDWRLPVTLHNLGVVYRQLGRYPDAERCYQRASAIFERSQPERKAELASLLFDLGALYLTVGELSRAEPLCRRSYELRLEALGPNHPLIGASLHGLARVAQECRRFREAEDDYRRAAAVLEAAYGPHSRELADLDHNWGMLYRDQARDAEARPLLERAAAIYTETASSHPKLAIILRNLAELEASAGNSEQAARLFERSIAICDASLPADHPQTGIVLQAYAQFLRRTSHKKEAEVANARANAILRGHSRTNYTVDLTELRSGR